MAYTNFIPQVWAEGIERDLERLCVFAEDCNRQYEGQVKKQGDQVHILGVGKPTISTVARANASNNISAAEEIEDSSVTMLIDQIRVFNYKVGDIDKAQAVGGIMDALAQETSEALANEIDKYISEQVVDAAVPKLTATPSQATASTVLGLLDDAIQKLQENDVKGTTKVVVTVSPHFYKLFKQAYIGKASENVPELKNGKVGMYGNVVVKMSNNVHQTTETVGGASKTIDNIMIRTQRAVAFAKPLTHTEAYRPELSFADAVKGFVLFGAKVVRPKEMVNINVYY